jgi:8-oxo-dGTP pyrophosphatase MutT (NUDIX family)
MTLEELLDIWSLDFKQIWYRIWLNTNCDTELYKRKYTKFYTSFIKTDNGTYLRNLLQQVRNYNYLNWEVPKGRPKNMQETNLDCAIREMKEETGLNKPDYFIIPNVRRYVNYISLGTRYICTYYIALINPNIKYFNHNIFKNMSNFTEISETKWFDIDKIRTVDDHKHHLESLVKPAFVLIKKYIAGKWLTRYRKLKLD